MTDLEATWDAIRKCPEVPLADAFSAEPDRLSRFAFEEAGLLFDFSKTHLSGALVERFAALAEAAGFAARRDALFSGAAVNTSEGRAAEHPAERGCAG
jgi:glucose-6-phosphate isomerase